MSRNKNRLATAGSLESIREAIIDFYCGSIKTLEADGENRWRVIGRDGLPNIGVVVVLRRGRYCFEMVI